MLAYIKNKNNEIIEVDKTPQEINELLKQGFTRPTIQERQEYAQKQNTKQEAKKGFENVYFIYPSSGKDGYGSSGENLKNALLHYKIQLNTEYQGQKVGLVYHHPYLLEQLKTDYKIIYTMFESTKVPEDWGKYLHLADEVIVPSQFIADAFKKQFNIDAKVINLGYDDNIFKPIHRGYKDELVFLHYDAFKLRKGWDILFNAFTKEFTKNEPVKLIFKTTVENTPPLHMYPNIEVLKGKYTTAELCSLLSRSDCFVFPTRGEGFGLTPLEALATGLNVVVPNALGVSEYFNDAIFYNLNNEKIKAIYDSPKMKGLDLGYQYKVSEDDLRGVMREIFNKWKSKKLHDKGVERAEYAQNYTINKTAQELSKVITKYTQKKDYTCQIAMMMENIQYYSGGRYHNFMQAVMLKEAGYDVKVYTNLIPKFIEDFKEYDLPEVVVVDDIETVDVEADIYLGSPTTGSKRAIELGAKYKKPVNIFVFDPPNAMLQSEVVERRELQRHDMLKNLLHEYKSNLKNTKIVTLTKNAIDDFSNYYEIDKKYFTYAHPAVNSRVSNLFTHKNKKNWVVAVSRNNRRKGWDEVIKVFKDYANHYELHVITHDDKGMKEWTRREGIPDEKVKIHCQISDLEKFRIISQSKVMISASKFEGFGMWAIEALACKTPIVCYDLEPLKEVQGAIYRAKCFEVGGLKQQLNQALVDKEPQIEKKHSFESQQQKLISRLNLLPKEKSYISCMYILLNEGKFIKQSIESVINKPSVKNVIIVEGAVKGYKRASDEGLSVDNTEDIINELQKKYPDKIIYHRHGWAENKEELRQKCLDIAYFAGIKSSNWGLFIDGDEVFSDKNFKKLEGVILTNKYAGVIYFKHLHFWKDYHTLAVGSAWDMRLFRLFRFVDEDLKIKKHASEPYLNGVPITQQYKTIFLNDVFVHHYGGVKDSEDIKAKLDYYKQRDTNLNVTDTWTDWEKGKPTQWTHGGGDVIPYNGEHPETIL